MMALRSASLGFAPRFTISSTIAFQLSLVSLLPVTTSGAWHSPQTFTTAALPGPAGSFWPQAEAARMRNKAFILNGIRKRPETICVKYYNLLDEGRYG